VDITIKIIGQMVKELCLKRGLTLEEMAERSGYTQGFVSQLENNKAVPSITTLYSITDALSVNVIDFFPQGIDPTKLTRHDSLESFHFKGSTVVFRSCQPSSIMELSAFFTP
jgi:transcriptional regulator with XRE-family HTH domain